MWRTREPSGFWIWTSLSAGMSHSSSSCGILHRRTCKPQAHTSYTPHHKHIHVIHHTISTYIVYTTLANVHTRHVIYITHAIFTVQEVKAIRIDSHQDWLVCLELLCVWCVDGRQQKLVLSTHLLRAFACLRIQCAFIEYCTVVWPLPAV